MSGGWRAHGPVLGVQPQGTEWLLWLATYLLVHATLDLTVAVSVADATNGNFWALGPAFAMNVLVGFIAAQAVIGLEQSVRRGS